MKGDSAVVEMKRGEKGENESGCRLRGEPQRDTRRTKRRPAGTERRTELS